MKAIHLMKWKQKPKGYLTGQKKWNIYLLKEVCTVFALYRLTTLAREENDVVHEIHVYIYYMLYFNVQISYTAANFW